jgi:DNA repair exonuclease SbcCD nuclease subunit
VIIVATSDWHLDASTDGVPRWDEIEALVEQSVNCAIEEHADYYVFCGDLCDPDGWNVWRSVSKLIEIAGRLADAGIKFIAVAGNHDVVDDGLGSTTLSPLASSGAAFHVFEQPGEVICPSTRKGEPDVRFVGFPFTALSHRYDPFDALRRYGREKKGEQIVVLEHLNVSGVGVGSETKDFARGREVIFPLEEVQRKWPNALILGGHYHRSQNFRGLEIIGSLARLRHDEEDHDPAILVFKS